MNHFIQGELKNELNFSELLERFQSEISNYFSLEKTISILDQFSKVCTNEAISSFCRRENLELKIDRELGADFELGELRRIDKNESSLQGYNPLGIVFHILPSNSEGLSFLAMIETIITGNISVLKLSKDERERTFELLKELSNVDKESIIVNRIFVLGLSSKDSSSMRKVYNLVDAVSAWGSEASISAIRSEIPAQVRFIPWGHKISFSYIQDLDAEDEVLKLLANECVVGEQMACSSPQCFLVEVRDMNDFFKVKDFALRFSKILNQVSMKEETASLSISEQAEITNYKLMGEYAELMEDSLYIEAEDLSWRILVENKSGLSATPLNRSIVIRPILRDRIIRDLYAFRQYLQTTSVISKLSEIAGISGELIRAGVSRITLPGQMQESFSGEAHDGEFALKRFLKVVRVQLPSALKAARLSDYEVKESLGLDHPLMTKEIFQQREYDQKKSEVYFRSGGSSGTAAISPFSYKKYNLQMQYAAEGLVAAGLEPQSDRVMNLFFGGGLYGGFISFFTILEKLRAIQFPMSGYDDLEFVKNSIVEQEVDTLIGMPSYIIKLFSEFQDELRGKVKKIFYGGEPFSQKQIEWIKNEMKIDLIRSAAYGSVDAGPLGFQCEYSSGGVHHIHQNIHELEILKIGEDQHISKESEEVGRLVFTSKARESIQIERYEIGDLGHWVTEVCPCGRKSPRVNLKGRMGDAFKVGGSFISAAKIASVLEDACDYQSLFQIQLKEENLQTQMSLLVVKGADLGRIRETLLSNYFDLNEVIEVERTTKLLIIETDKFETSSSGKHIRFRDERGSTL